MSELTLLKIEARELLAQVNQHFETSPNGRRIKCSSWENEHLYKEMSFKERVDFPAKTQKNIMMGLPPRAWK